MRRSAENLESPGPALISARVSTPSGVAPALLLVDDEEIFRERLAAALRARGFRVVTAESAVAAQEAASREVFDHAVIDLRMPGPSGLELTAWLRERSPDTRVVVLTGFGSIASAVEAMRSGAHHYLSKPADADDVVAALRGPIASSTKRQDPPPSLARAEWEHIQRILSAFRGNVSETARRLRISRRTLQLKLKRIPPQS